MTSPGQHCGTPTMRYTAHEQCEHGRGGGAGHGCDDGARCDTVVHMTLIVAHRGRHDIHPENSPEAFIAAVEQGADGIELDVRCSRDGVPVVHHDPVLADGRVIADTDAESMSDVVCTLVEALDACHGAFVNIEIKNRANRVTTRTHGWWTRWRPRSNAGAMQRRDGCCRRSMRKLSTVRVIAYPVCAPRISPKARQPRPSMQSSPRGTPGGTHGICH